MILNFNVKVKGGKRTSPDVKVYYTAVNEKTISFANGKEITNTQIAEWIQENLQNALEKFSEQT